jgi:hypothetical protein
VVSPARACVAPVATVGIAPAAGQALAQGLRQLLVSLGPDNVVESEGCTAPVDAATTRVEATLVKAGPTINVRVVVHRPADATSASITWNEPTQGFPGDLTQRSDLLRILGLEQRGEAASRLAVQGPPPSSPVAEAASTPPVHLPVLAIVSAALGAGAAGTGTYFALAARGHYRHVQDDGYVGRQLEIGRTRDDAMHANLAFGAAVLFIAGAVASYFWENDPGQE